MIVEHEPEHQRVEAKNVSLRIPTIESAGTVEIDVNWVFFYQPDVLRKGVQDDTSCCFKPPVETELKSRFSIRSLYCRTQLSHRGQQEV